MGTIKGLGIDYPIGKGNTGFFKQTFETFTNVKSKINVLLRTMEKERPFNQDFGIGLHRYLFEPLTRELNIILEDKIRDKVAKEVSANVKAALENCSCIGTVGLNPGPNGMKSTYVERLHEMIIKNIVTGNLAK